jgi:Type VI secretion system/phage-baseplate injector OB domain
MGLRQGVAAPSSLFMDGIFETLRQSKQASKQASDLNGRSPFTQFGIVTNNEDPTGKRRVRVTLQSKGGQTETDWLYRVLDCPYDDPPLPRLGQTVMVGFIEGDPHSGVYGGIITNEPNPERKKEDAEKDDWRWVEGDKKLEVQGKWDIHTEKWTWHHTQLLMEDLFRLWLADALPPANEENRGKMLVVKGVECASPDKAFICLKGRDKAYEWKEFASGNTKPC